MLTDHFLARFAIGPAVGRDGVSVVVKRTPSRCWGTPALPLEADGTEVVEPSRPTSWPGDSDPDIVPT